MRTRKSSNNSSTHLRALQSRKLCLSSCYVDPVLIQSRAGRTPLACATAMAHPVTTVQEFFQKAGQTGPEALVYEFSDYCTDTPLPEKRFVCSLKTPRCPQTHPPARAELCVWSSH